MNRQSYRLPAGGRIDRARPLRFRFNGTAYQGYMGDTLASALLANDVHLIGRSFKLHRPRGVVGAGVEDASGLVQLGEGARTEPNMRAAQIALYDGLAAASANCWPSVRFDLAAAFDRVSRLLPPGFYYKTFMSPRRLWPAYERVIRRAAGIGRAPAAPDPDRYEHANIHCDVMVVGGGPAGLAAALAAGRTGARVILADEQSEFGGALLAGRQEIDGLDAAVWTARAVAALAEMDEVVLLPRATVTGHYDHNYLTCLERVADHLPPPAPLGVPRQRQWHVRAAQVVLAAGAIERPLVFADNDRPGVMLASAARTYANRYAVQPGSRAVVFTNNDSAYAAAADLAAAGVAVQAIVDPRADPGGPAVGRARDAGIEIAAGQAVVDTAGRGRVRSVTVMGFDAASGRLTGAPRRLDCDLAAMSGGWSPTVHLWSQAQGKLRFDGASACLLPDGTLNAVRCAGAMAGSWGLDTCLRQGAEAGARAAGDAGFGDGGANSVPSAAPSVEEPLLPVWQVPAHGALARGSRHFVDLLNDVTVADIALAQREGYDSPEHAKRYTTLGMGTDQGKTSNVNGAAILAGLMGTDVASIGTTTFRPPYASVTIGAMAGRDIGPLVQPRRKLPLNDWHAGHGAVFDHVGLWARPRYYRKDAEDMDAAVRRECLAVRNRVGLIDGSTFGKIDLQGPDCVAFLNRLYTNAWDGLAVGRCKYGLMLGEDGMVFDDGVTARLAENHYFMTTNSGNAPAVVAWLERWLQREWRDLTVYPTSVVTQWATITVCGPDARRLVETLGADIDLSREAFPFLAVREGMIGAVPACVLRVSYTGELSYEIFVPASYATVLWRALWDAGQALGVEAVGTEAGNVLRTEKGFIGVGHDTDGTVTPDDLGMAWLVGRNKADFIGKRSLARPDTRRGDRLQLVGILADAPQVVLPEGAQIVAAGGPAVGVPLDGVVTTSFFSPTLERHGERVAVPLEGRTVMAAVASPVFFDPAGERIHA